MGADNFHRYEKNGLDMKKVRLQEQQPVRRYNGRKCSFIIVIKDEIPRNEINKNLQIFIKIKILLKNTKNTWTNLEA